MGGFFFFFFFFFSPFPAKIQSPKWVVSSFIFFSFSFLFLVGLWVGPKCKKIVTG
jgi:hypothetical protein